MGDKGGRKDKEKGERQNARKQKNKAKARQDKLPKANVKEDKLPKKKPRALVVAGKAGTRKQDTEDKRP